MFVSASGISNTIFLPSDPDELCDRLKLLLQEKKAGNNSNKINEDIVAIIDKLLEYKCTSKKQHEQILFEGNLLHTEKVRLITHINKCIHKYKYSYNCMYTQI